MISVFSDLLEEERSRIGTHAIRSETDGEIALGREAWFADYFEDISTAAGVRINQHTALQIVTFLACVDLIASNIAAMPVHVYEKYTLPRTKREARRIAADHPHEALIGGDPNDEMTGHTFTKTFLLHALVWGGGFAEIQWLPSGYAAALWPRSPERTTFRRTVTPMTLEPEPWRPWPVGLPAGSLIAETTDGMGATDKALDFKPRILPMADVLYVPGITFDGRIAESVVWLCRQLLGHALAVEKFGAKYFANFARPGGMLELPNMRPEDREKLKQEIYKMQSGSNMHRLFMPPPGSKYTQTTNNPEDAQANETRSQLRSDIAAVFHVAARFVGDTSKASRASAEQDATELLNYSLRPWINGISQEWRRKLFPSQMTARGRVASPYFIGFDTSDLLRPDAQSREKYLSSGRQWGGLSINDWCEADGRNPVDEDWAEERWMPVNMTLARTPVLPGRDLIKPGDPASPDPDAATTEEDDEVDTGD